PNAVGDPSRDGAPDGAMGADALACDHRYAGRRRRSGLRSLHGTQRQAAECCEPAGDEAGAAKEDTTVEIAVGLGMQQRATGQSTLALRGPTDEHRSLPQPG